MGLFSLLLTSCFDAPVREDLRLRFLPNGMVVATSTIRIEDPEQSNPALQKRLAEVRQAILEGSDPWSVRFAAAKPGAERSSWEKRLGALSSAAHSAVLTEPRDLEELFRDTSLSVSYSVRPERGIAELSIVPGPSTRASRRQREETERTLDAWTGELADYLRAVQALYAYLDDHPDRARPCFANLFDKKEGAGELTAGEAHRLEGLNDAMEKVLAVLTVPPDAAYSPDEVSQRVYDPFPARLSLKLPGEPLEVEGFRKSAEGGLVARSLGLWEALRSLQGKWISPDPVLVYVEGSRGEDHEVDLEGFLQKPRRTVPAHLLPSGREMRSEIEGRLRPEPLYRVSWKVDPADESKFGWDDGESR
jgi:hypothetical protein